MLFRTTCDECEQIKNQYEELAGKFKDDKDYTIFSKINLSKNDLKFDQHVSVSS